MKFRFQPSPEFANPANLPASQGGMAGRKEVGARRHGPGFASDSQGFATDSHAGTRMDKGDSRDSRDSQGSRAAHTEKRYLSPALESRIRAMGKRWDYAEEELAQVLEAARDDPEGWMRVVVHDEQQDEKPEGSRSAMYSGDGEQESRMERAAIMEYDGGLARDEAESASGLALCGGG